jgi:hypothetical protein
MAEHIVVEGGRLAQELAPNVESLAGDELGHQDRSQGNARDELLSAAPLLVFRSLPRERNDEDKSPLYGLEMLVLSDFLRPQLL